MFRIVQTFLMAVGLVLLTGCLTQNNEEPSFAESPSAPPAAYPESNSGSSSQPPPPPPVPATAQPTTGNPKPSGKKRTYSGLEYEVLRPGSGAQPRSYNRVKVHYHGYLPNGTVFDSSVQRGTPAVFGLNQVIPGWTEGIQLMNEGAKYRFTIPPNLAYGSSGSPPKIGPNQTLIFEVELLEVLY